MANNSLYAIDGFDLPVGHDPWIHAFPKIAPKPMSDASEKSNMSEASMELEGGIMDDEDHVGRKSNHHFISALASELRVM